MLKPRRMALRFRSQVKTHTSTSSVYRKHPARRKQRMMRNKMINKMSLKLRLHRLVFHIMSTKFQSNIYTLRFDIIIKVCLYLKLCFGSLHNRRRLTLVRERTNNQRYAQPCRGEIIEDRCSCSIFETQLSSTRVLDLQSLSKCEDYMHISSWVYEI